MLTLALIVLAVGAVLRYARVGALRGEATRVYVAAPEARGIAPGSDVWLNGRKVGMVHDVRFADATVPLARRVVLELELLEEYRPFVHRDAEAQIAAGGTLVGAQVVHLSRGTPTAPSIRAGDTLQATAQSDFEAIASDLAMVGREIPALVSTVQLLGTQVRSSQGTVGALLGDPNGLPVAATQARLASLRSRVTGGNGTVARALRAPTLATRARGLLGRVSSVRATLLTGRGTVARLRGDSAFIREVRLLRDELAIVRTLLAEADGTIPRLQRDSALTVELARAQTEMAQLFRDIRRNPIRYVHF